MISVLESADVSDSRALNKAFGVGFSCCSPCKDCRAEHSHASHPNTHLSGMRRLRMISVLESADVSDSQELNKAFGVGFSMLLAL